MENIETKQILIVRKDLNMRKGKLVAQCAHASLKSILNLGKISNNVLSIPLTSTLLEWLDGRYTKICVYVNSEAELTELYAKAKALRMPTVLITDLGLTEFKGVPTVTCCAIGPAKSETIDKLTSHLPLL
jgi:PTH2 family peptidyl-tRNA hydrolase